ncbi:MAG: F0F1 ATP synthase subunit A [Planctomycetales bacterium]
MLNETLLPETVLKWGPVEVTSTVIYSLIVSAVLIVLAIIARLGLKTSSSSLALMFESLLDSLDGILRDMASCDPRPYSPLVITLTLFIGVSNLSGLFPGMHAPTADISTTTALAIIVFIAVPFYGIRAQGLRGYLRHYVEPSILFLPLELIAELSRTISLAVRLFGNIMSEEMVIAVLLSIAGLIVPVPIMMLSVLTGIVQAYIFAVLTIVYLSAAIRTGQQETGTP